MAKSENYVYPVRNFRFLNGVKKIIISLFFTFLCYGVIQPISLLDWKKQENANFIIYYRHVIPESFISTLLSLSSVYYEIITDGIGYTYYNKHWIGDERCKIFLYKDKADFVNTGGGSYYSGGNADLINKVIRFYATSEELTKSVLPHEIAHLIFRDAVGLRLASWYVPLWLDEGVAQYFEDEIAKKSRNQILQSLVRTNRLMSWNDLMEGDAYSIAFYTQAASMIEFLIKKGGIEQFAMFCNKLKNGNYLDESVRFAYSGLGYSKAQDIYTDWVKSIKKKNIKKN